MQINYFDEKNLKHQGDTIIRLMQTNDRRVSREKKGDEARGRRG